MLFPVIIGDLKKNALCTMYGPWTDPQTNRASYRDAWTHLKEIGREKRSTRASTAFEVLRKSRKLVRVLFVTSEFEDPEIRDEVGDRHLDHVQTERQTDRPTERQKTDRQKYM